MAKEIAAGRARFEFGRRRLVLQIDDETTMEGQATVCTAPDCPCFHLLPDAHPELSVGFRCSDRTCHWDGAWPAQTQQGLQAALSDVEWTLFSEIFTHFRHPLQSPYTPEEVRSLVTLKDLNSGLTIPVDLLFPMAKPLTKDVFEQAADGSVSFSSHLALCDSYCAAPACSCNACEAHVHGQVEKQGAQTVRVAAFRLDLNTGAIVEVHNSSAGYSADAALRDVSAAIPDFLQELRWRRKIVRKIVADAWDLEEPKHNRRVPVGEGPSGMARKIGRNERCICGSGKKFKHCCGG